MYNIIMHVSTCVLHYEVVNDIDKIFASYQIINQGNNM